MKRINSDEELEQILQNAVDNSPKDSFKIIAGHMPMAYQILPDNNYSIGVDPYQWGIFSTYTFLAGARLLKYIIDSDREGSLLVVVDDLMELPQRLSKEGNEKLTHSWLKRKRRNFYHGKADLPDEYKKILFNYELSLANIIPQIRDDDYQSILISEKLAKAKANTMKITSKNHRALAYKGILTDSDLFNPSKDYLVSFMPGQFKADICEGLLEEQKNLDSLHIFFPDAREITDNPSKSSIPSNDEVNKTFRVGVYLRDDFSDR